MLESLSVRNYALIDELDIEFSSGLTVLTGETGSGKSIMLGALSLLLGARADKESVRAGASSAEITGVFHSASPQVAAWLSSHDVEAEDGELLVRRSIKATGRSSYSVNGVPVTRQDGEALGFLLVDISSQHSHQSLVKEDTQRKLLDSALPPGTFTRYSSCYSELKALEKQKRELEDLLSKAEEENDYMRFCLSELEKAGLKEGEEEEIRSRLSVINSSEFLHEHLEAALGELRSASSSLSEAQYSLAKASSKDDSITKYAEQLESLAIDADDLVLTVRDLLEGTEFSPEELEALNERLSVIQRMKRRFGGSVEEALRRQAEYKEKLALSEDSEAARASLDKRIALAEKKLREAGDELTKERKAAASRLEAAVTGNLQGLGMKAAVFTVSLAPLSEPGPDGFEQVQFLLASNKGEKRRPIGAIASGGELSRIMLAIKVSMNSTSDVETLLFDEIDAGLGGTTANAVASKLKLLSERDQVICITHLAQIASRASSHYMVYKEESGGRTYTHVTELRDEGRVEEIARLLSGETSKISIDHARELLEVQGSAG